MASNESFSCGPGCPISASKRRMDVPPCHRDRGPRRCYRAADQDARFDGWFFCAVTSTGIYCRRAARPGPPSGRTCASTPRRPRRNRPGSGPAGGAGPTPPPARPSGTSGPTSWPGPCGSSATASSTARASRGWRRGWATAPASSTVWSRPSWARARWPSPAPSAARRHGSCWRPPIWRSRRRLRGRLRQHPPVQRHHAPDLRRHAQRPTARARRCGGAPAGGGDGAAQAIRLRLPCRRPFNPASVLDFLAPARCPGVEAADGDAYRRTPAPAPRPCRRDAGAPPADDISGRDGARPTWRPSCGSPTCAT